MLAPWRESHDKPRQSIKRQKHHFADKGLYSQSYGFSRGMYGCESWTIKKAVQFSSVIQSCPTLCDPMNRSTPGLPVYHQLPEFTQIHIHRVSDAIQRLISVNLVLDTQKNKLLLTTSFFSVEWNYY